MKTRTWILLLALLLAASIGLSIPMLLPGEASTHAEILSQGDLIESVDLRIDREFTVTTEDGGRNVITVKDGKIAVTEANCPDHYCMQRGYCSSGSPIVCLPNRLTVRFAGEQTIDAIVG